MLSWKQRWRKTLPPKTSLYNQDDQYDLLSQPNKSSGVEGKCIHRKLSTPTSSSSSNKSGRLKSCLSVSSELGLKGLKPPRRIRFSSYLKVCLIPTRKELFPLADELYWSLAQCEDFKTEALRDIRAYAQQMGCSFKCAITALFQPSESPFPSLEDLATDDTSRSTNSNFSDFSENPEKMCPIGRIQVNKADLPLHLSMPSSGWEVSWEKG
jgi:hypothetical protein